MLHQSQINFILRGDMVAAGEITNFSSPIDTSCFKTALFLCKAESISAEDTLDIDIYTINTLNGMSFLLDSFVQITANGNFSLKITENLGLRIYAIATVAGAAAVSCTFELHVVLQD